MWHGQSEAERREFFRVDGRVRLHYRRVEEPENRSGEGESVGPGDMEAPKGCENVAASHSDGCSPEELLRALSNRVARMEAKLDALWRFFANRWPPEELQLTPCLVNISGCGMRFPTSERFQVGDRLEVTLELPVMPHNLLRLTGEVVHVLEPEGDGSPDGPFQTAIRFLSSSDTEREHIVRYTMKRQYEDIRRTTALGVEEGP